VLRAVVALTLLLAPSYGVVAQTNSHPDSAQPSQGFFQRFGGWGDGKQSSLVQDVKVDSRGRIWVATEDSGLWTCNATNAQSTWTQFNKDTGLPDDNCRVLLCDTLGRVWVGTENSGLAVYNGVTWRNYDSLNGPLGSHIFSIAQDPLDGSIWISTENGLSRYSDSSKTWQYFTTADGLPSNQANVLAFDKVGDLFVGSHCDGMANLGTSCRVHSDRQMPPVAMACRPRSSTQSSSHTTAPFTLERTPASQIAGTVVKPGDTSGGQIGRRRSPANIHRPHTIPCRQ
jgi:ligand-binding sensor domain-containing protein